MEEGAKNLYV